MIRAWNVVKQLITVGSTTFTLINLEDDGQFDLELVPLIVPIVIVVAIVVVVVVVVIVVVVVVVVVIVVVI